MDQTLEECPYRSSLEIIKTLTLPTEGELVLQRKVYLGPTTKRLTLIFDLDQTLVTAQSSTECKNTPTEYTIIVRPYTFDLLQYLSKDFELVIFTTANVEYATQAFDFFNASKVYFTKLLTNEFCTLTKEGYFVKDLRVFADRSLDKLLIIDDSIISFAFQLGNGIPVEPFNGSPDDQELLHLKNYLEGLFLSEDPVKRNSELIGIVSSKLSYNEF